MKTRIIGYDDKYEAEVSKLNAKFNKKYGDILGYDEYAVSADYQSLFFPDLNTLKENYSLENRNILYDLVHGKFAVYRVKPYAQNSITAKFDLAGLTKIIKPYSNMCQLPSKAESTKIIKEMIKKLNKSLNKYE